MHKTWRDKNRPGLVGVGLLENVSFLLPYLLLNNMYVPNT